MGAAPVNPYVDHGPWGTVAIGGLVVPGVVRSINGAERPEEWSVQRPTIASNAITVWRGTKLAEAIKITTDLPLETDYPKYVAVRDRLRPKIGRRPPTHAIVNAHVNFSDITRVSCRNISAPQWDRGRGVWFGVITVIQYAPPRRVNIGAAKAPKAERDPDADLKAQIKQLTAVAKKL